MSFILEGLYVGGLDDINEQKLEQIGISHVLTVDIKPLPIECRESFTYMHIHALDMEDFDLLGRITDAIQFIEEGRNHGGVIVHCNAGQSRSATLVIAYVMQKMDLNLNETVALLRKQRPQISPNTGFLEQLELFEKMGNSINLDSQLYKQYRLQNLAVQVQTAQLGAFPSQSLSSDPSLGIKPQEIYYKCKKCRRPLFKNSAILNHTEGFGESSFSWQKNLGEREDAPDCDTSLFIEPVQWMDEDILQIEGKLSCPKCRSKIGSFKWTGEKCPCGTWVTPAFHVQKNKVDKTSPQVHKPLPLLKKPPTVTNYCEHGAQTQTDTSIKVTNSQIFSTNYEPKKDIICNYKADVTKNFKEEPHSSTSNNNKVIKTKLATNNNMLYPVGNENVHNRCHKTEFELITGLGEAVAACNLRQNEDLPPL